MIRRTNRPGMGRYVPANVPGLLNPFNGLGVQQGQKVAPQDAAQPPAVVTLDMEALARQGEAVFKTYGGRSIAAPDKPAYDTRPPWIEMPGGAQPYLYQAYPVIPANDGLDHEVLAFTLPFGWDGIIDQFANFYTGPGNTMGAGFLTWRLLRNGQAIKGFDAIQAAFGQYGNGGIIPMDLGRNPIRVFSEERISLVVNHAVASTLPLAGVYTPGVVGGYFYARVS